MTSNRAVIYSNGIADFRRRYDVEGTLQVAIPVKQEHVADVLASLHVLGDVKLSSPPTFRPANEAAGSLSLDTDNVITGLARSLGGAEVRVRHGGEELQGILAGLQTHREAHGGDAVDVRSLVVLADGSLVRVPVNDIASLSFLDEAVQAELDKALQRQVQQIKPNSTFVELELASDSPAEALVQYTVPSAAWKISYRLRRLDDEAFELQGYAIVDNNTDEDWRDFKLAVVTGEPITFSTDLADSKAPSRGHVDIVREQALGAVEPEAAMMRNAMAVGGMAVMAGEAADEDDAALYEMQAMRKMGSRADDYPARRAAAVEEAEVRESGDFCIYEAKLPVSIDSNRSAVLPVFTVALSQARSVLHFKEDNHATRPYRAVQFVNETDHSLGRGVCTVFESGVYGGSCILPATKPGAESLLPHALETGVQVRVEPRGRQEHVTGLRLSEGVCHQQAHYRCETTYRIASSRDETCHLVLDHRHQLPNPKSEATEVADGQRRELPVNETLSHGVRLRTELSPRGTLDIQVVETITQESRVVLAGDHGEANMKWLTQNIVLANGPLADHPAVKECERVQRQLDAKISEIAVAERDIQRLSKRQERLRANIGAGGNDQQSAKWLADLGKAEDRLVEIEERQLPQLFAERKQIEQQLYEALRAIDAAWSENP